MRTFAAAALVAAVSASSEIEAAFLGYIVQFGKNYDSVAEFNFRFEQFTIAHKEILEHNAVETSYKLGHNKMSDWTNAEYKAILTYIPEENVEGTVAFKATGTASEPINWVELGAVEPIQDQGQCGSCWAFSSVSAFEAAHFIAGNTLEKFSEQQLVDCVNLCYGCNGGNATFSFHYYQNHYAMTESSYPYTAKDGTCSYDANSNTGVYCTNWTSVTGSDVTAMKEALASAPLSVAIQADQRIFQSYSSGVFTNTACGTSLDHATNVVGWGIDPTDGDYWLMRNSWGTSWGEEGYMKLQIVDGVGLCGIQMQPVYPYSN